MCLPALLCTFTATGCLYWHTALGILLALALLALAHTKGSQSAASQLGRYILAASHSHGSFLSGTCTTLLEHGEEHEAFHAHCMLCYGVQELEAEEYARKGVNLTPELWLVKLMVGAVDSRWVAPLAGPVRQTSLNSSVLQCMPGIGCPELCACTSSVCLQL